jgi:mono/diheme cytochrome c family protein
MSKVVVGALGMLAMLLLGAVGLGWLGLAPVSADGPHSRLEARVMPLLLHAAVARRASGEKSSVVMNEDNLKAGSRTYRTMCATCHSTATGGPSVYGEAFYPPAPRLANGLPQYTEAEVFWIIKHGIRNTGMPAWSRVLSDEEIWQVVGVLKRADGPAGEQHSDSGG